MGQISHRINITHGLPILLIRLYKKSADDNSSALFFNAIFRFISQPEI
jgi:hypothetical protein